MVVLAKFGVPPNMVKVISNMYTNCTVKVDVGDTEYVIKATAGVKQGDNLAPVLFLIYIQAVLETLDEKHPERKKLPFKTKFNHVLHGHYNYVHGAESFTVGESLYADDAFFGFATRAELAYWAPIIDRHFTAFGLQVHKGKILPNGKKKKSKTECMYFPRRNKTQEDGDISDVAVDNGFYTFTDNFKYLGSIISWDLSADADIAKRIRSATGSFAKLRSVLRNKRTHIKQRSAIYATIVLSILLYGGEYWAMREDLLQKLEVFHNQCVRDMCHITKNKQRFEKIKTTSLNERMGLVPIRDMICTKQLRWFGHVVRMSNNRAPKQLLTCWIDHKRELGRPCQMFGHSVKKFLNMRSILNLADRERQFTFTRSIEGIETTKVLTAVELSLALTKTSGKTRDGELTCIDLCVDRVLWRKIVKNKYAPSKRSIFGHF
jgi:hypothetical protein